MTSTLTGAEPHLHRQRPPLSKTYLLGEMELERLFLRPESFPSENIITLRLGQPVTGIDPQAKTLALTYFAVSMPTGGISRCPSAIAPASSLGKRMA